MVGLKIPGRSLVVSRLLLSSPRLFSHVWELSARLLPAQRCAIGRGIETVEDPRTNRRMPSDPASAEPVLDPFGKELRACVGRACCVVLFRPKFAYV